MLYHSPSPIEATLAERLIRTIKFLISRYCKLKNTAVFNQDLDKIMQIDNQCLDRFLSNIIPQEVHRGDHDTLDPFLKQYFSEKFVNKKFKVGNTVKINKTSSIFKRGIISGLRNF